MVSRKRANGLEPSTFSLEGCKPQSQDPDLTGTYEHSNRGRSDSASDSKIMPKETHLKGVGLDPELRSLIEAWTTLPVSVRMGIMAIVKGIC